MGIKDLFIEREDEDEEIDLGALSAGLDEAEEVPQVETPEVTEDDEFATLFVANTYMANNLDDLHESIFKVEELSNTLPKEMPTDTKRTTVTSIMQTVGLSVDDAVTDGEARVKILNTTLEMVVNQLTEAANDSEEKIETLKKQIADEEALIAKSKATVKSITENTSTEVDRINNLVKFIKGV